jgi:pyruvate dehydrogenase E1 component
MVAEQEDVFYYLTLMNENYVHPAMPEGAEEGILRGMYLLREAAKPKLQEAARAAARLGHDPARGAGRRGAARGRLRRAADVWSVTSFTELRRDGIEVERWNMLHPLEPPRALRRPSASAPGAAR